MKELDLGQIFEALYAVKKNRELSSYNHNPVPPFTLHDNPTAFIINDATPQTVALISKINCTLDDAKRILLSLERKYGDPDAKLEDIEEKT